MSRNAVRRDLARHAAETRRPAEAYRSREPLRRVRLGDRVQVRAGELLTVVDETGRVELGQVRAAAAGVFTLDGDAAEAAAEAARQRAALTASLEVDAPLDDDPAA